MSITEDSTSAIPRRVGRLKDQASLSILRPTPSTAIQLNNVQKLPLADVGEHLGMLGKSVSSLSRLLYERLPEAGGDDNELQDYLLRLGTSLTAITMKGEMDALSPSPDTAMPITIDPTDSGFPVVSREYTLLLKDKERALAELAGIPDDSDLVKDAVLDIFRSRFPTKQRQLMVARAYYQALSEIELPEDMYAHPLRLLKTDNDGSQFGRKCFERLDDRNNLPRFYTFFLRICKTGPLMEHEDLEGTIDKTIAANVSSVMDSELTGLANAVDAIDGVQVQQVHRYDIGPFFNRFTENKEPISTIFEKGRADDSVLLYRKVTVTRMGEKPKQGMRNKFLAFMSGDHTIGQFSPSISSPDYAILPHRLIQRVHHLDINIGPNVKMYGTTSDGGILD